MPQRPINPERVLENANWWLASSRATRHRHATRKGRQQRPERRSDLTNAVQGTHDVGKQMRRARAQAAREGGTTLTSLWSRLAEASDALQRERRYLRRMLDRTR